MSFPRPKAASSTADNGVATFAAYNYNKEATLALTSICSSMACQPFVIGSIIAALTPEYTNDSS
jgi:hypothetical protein